MNTKDLFMSLARAALAKKKRALGETELLRKPKTEGKSQVSATTVDSLALDSLASVSTDSPTPPPAKLRAISLEQKREFPKRYFSVQAKRYGWQKANGQCEFVSALGKRCDAKHELQFDHKTPYAHGGESSEENVRVLCRVHNTFEAVRYIGRGTMARYQPSLR